MKQDCSNTLDAFIYDGDLQGSNGIYYVPKWAEKAFLNGVLFYDSIDEGPPCELFLKTADGKKHINVGDYVVFTNGTITSCANLADAK